MNATHRRLAVIAAVTIAAVAAAVVASGPPPGGADRSTEAARASFQVEANSRSGKPPVIHVDSQERFASSETAGVDDSSYRATAPTSSNPTAGYCKSGLDRKIRVVYARIQTSTDRYDALLPTLRAKTELADQWLWQSAKEQGGYRHYRFLCTSGGKIGVDRVTLPDSAKGSKTALLAALRAAGYDVSTRKYLVYADFKLSVNPICGFGEFYDDPSPAQSNANNQGNQIAVVYVRSCSTLAQAAMHELGHILGGVVSAAPRHDPRNAAHPRDQNDVMAYGSNTYAAAGCSAASDRLRYDCNKNDYFSVGSLPTWNIADNQFLVGATP